MNSAQKFDYSDLKESERPYVDYDNPMQYRLTFYTRTAKDGRLKVYTYYWESPEHDQEIYKVRTDYIEFLTYKFRDTPQLVNGLLHHRSKSLQVYDHKKERLVSRFTPVMLRKTNPFTKTEQFDIDYNFFSEKARRTGSRIVEFSEK